MNEKTQKGSSQAPLAPQGTSPFSPRPFPPPRKEPSPREEPGERELAPRPPLLPQMTVHAPEGGEDAEERIQRKIGVEIEVGNSAFELRNEAGPRDLTQSQTVATRDSAGKDVALKAEGPQDRQALAEFVTDAYSMNEKAAFLDAVGLLAGQAQAIRAGALGGWAIQGGNQVNILSWPDTPEGGFQFTISPVENTVVHLFNAFPATRVTSLKGGILTQKAPEDLEVAAQIQTLRVLTARNADILFWNWFKRSGLAVVALPEESPGELFNVIVALAEAFTWRFGTLLKDLGSTFKNTLDLMPKFDFVTLLDKQLRLFLGDEDFARKSRAAKEVLTKCFYSALSEQEASVMKAVSGALNERMALSEQFLKMYQEQMQGILEEEQAPEQSLASGFLNKESVQKNIDATTREIGIYKDLLSHGVRSTAQDVAAVLNGEKQFLGDITVDDPPSVMEDEGSLIPPDANAPEGAFEHRNPFDNKVSAGDWVEATTQFLALLEAKGVRY